METLLIKTKDKKELLLISDLLKRMKIEMKILSDEEKENFGLVKLMKEADRTKKVSREKIMEKLGK